jgi:WD40 repeat protein
MFGGTSGKVVLYDVATRMLHTRLGHSTRITVLTPPTPEFPYLISGDASGALRVWPLPETTVQLAATTASRLILAAPLAGHGPVIAAGYDTTIPWVARDGRAGELAAHATLHDLLAVSPARSRFAMYGTDESIEIWSFEPDAKLDVIRSRHDAVTAVAFAADGARLVVGTRDGALALWSGDAARELGSIHESVAVVRAVPYSELAVAAGASGALWLTGDGPLRALGTETDAITSLACSPDGRWLVVGTAVGTISLYELATRVRTPIVNVETWIELVGFSSDSRQIMYSTNGRLQIADLDRAPDRAPRLGAERVALPAHHATFSPDNAWLAATGDHGDLWFHRTADDHWVYFTTGIAQLSQGMFSEDGAQYVATDPSGRALVVDMHAPGLR